jgi:hypothetical protein
MNKKIKVSLKNTIYFLNNETMLIPSDNLKNKSSLLWSLCYSMGYWVAIGNTPTRFIF